MTRVTARVNGWSQAHMIFKNLPIELDPRGHARLRGEQMGDPFGLELLRKAQLSAQRQAANGKKPATRKGYRLFRLDPLTRTANRLSIQAVIDFGNRRLVSAQVERTSGWRLERLVVGRPATDAVSLISRSSGPGSGAHAMASAMALEMAYQVVPPPLAIVTRGLGAAAELIASHTRQLFLTAGPDYSEAAVSRTSMNLWRKAQEARAPGTIFHGYRTIAEIMRGMNPGHGHLYREALHLIRAACEVATLIFGKYPHPNTIFPGGVGVEADRELFHQVLGRINRLLDYAKKVTAIWDDLAEFFYGSHEHFDRLGESVANFLSVGLWDDTESYDATYAKSHLWGGRRYSTPGVIVNRKIRTTRLAEINAGFETVAGVAGPGETNGKMAARMDPLGIPLSPLHPWNGNDLGNGLVSEAGGPIAAPVSRWDREPMETGPLARLWLSTLGGKLKNEFIESVVKDEGAGLMFDVPKFHLPATILNWRVPSTPNALERNRARAYQIAYAGMIALTYLLKAFESLERGEKAMSTRYRLPAAAVGVGFWEEGPGALLHHAEVREGCLENYRVCTPDSWLGSSCQSFGEMGAFEQALMNTILVEEFTKPEDFTGIDLLRVIRSFDS